MTVTRRDLTALGENVERIDPVAPSLQDRVRRLVASRAGDRDDCRLLLEALGLVGGDPDPVAGP
ncbi:hypothetical protein [Kitasatospora sp. NPDC094015]|uniref:hypothetical protein n=1 Tax=Kitasatospora sp. NPDC094015 TaxID=3155205 RepID=UPI003318D964